MGRRCRRAKPLTAMEQRIGLGHWLEVDGAPPKIIFANAPNPDLDPLRRVRDAGGASRDAQRVAADKFAAKVLPVPRA
jgi:hypothetical protein